MKALNPVKGTTCTWQMKWTDNLILLLGDMGFRPCKADPDLCLWMRSKKQGNYTTNYEYISVMVDDLIFFSCETEHIIYLLLNYDLKEIGEPDYLLHTPLDHMPPKIIPAPSIPPEPPPRRESSSSSSSSCHSSSKQERH